MSCMHDSEQWVLYLAGLLDPADEHEAEAHLKRGCLTCEQQLAQARRLLDQLPFAVEPREPAPDVRQRLLARLADEPHPAPIPLHQPDQSAQPIKGGRLRQTVVRTLVACAAVAALAGGVTFLAMNQQLRQQHDEVVQLRQQIAQYDEQLSEYSVRTVHLEQLTALASELYTTLRSSPIEMIRMEGADEHESTSARLIWDRSRNVGHFVGPEGFRVGGDGRLKLWLVSNDDKAVSVGTFAPDEFGRARFKIGMNEEDLTSFHSAYISPDNSQTADEIILSGNF